MGICGEGGDLHGLPLLDPHRGRHRNIPVGLGNAQIVIAVSGGQGEGYVPGSGGHIFGIRHLATVHDDLHGAHSTVGEIRKGGRQIHGFSHPAVGQHGTKEIAVQFVQDLQVRILRGIDPAGAQSGSESLLCQSFRIDHSPSAVSGAPGTVVIVLVVGWGHMPACVQGHGVGIVAFCSLADHLQQSHGGIRLHAVMGEIFKFAVEGAVVVELADGAGDRGQGLVVMFQGCCIIGEVTLLAALEAGGEEGGNMAQAVVPGHFKSVKSQKISGGGGQGGFPAQSPFLADGGCILTQHALLGSVKGVGMVGNSQKIQPRYGSGIGISFHRCAGAIGIGGVAMKLAEEQAGPGGRGLLRIGSGFLRRFFLLYGSPFFRIQLRRLGGRFLPLCYAVQGKGKGGIPFG